MHIFFLQRNKMVQGDPRDFITSPYIAVIDEHWDNIIMVYTMFNEKKPIIEYHIDDQKIYSYSASDYIGALSDRTREATHTLYQDTLQSNQFMVFVKDTQNRRLRTYIFPIPDVSDSSSLG